MEPIRYRSTLPIDAPAERVWALTADVEGLPALTPTMAAVRRLDDGPLAVGSRVRIRQPGDIARTWTITELEAPQRLVWTTRVGPVRLTASHQITPVGEERCTNELGVDLDGPGARVLAALLGSRMRAALASEGAGFRTAAEQTAQAA